jgi:hypothetical protein
VLTIERMGWFTERRTTVALRLPRDGVKPLRLRLGRGSLDLDLRGFSPSARLEVDVGEGDVRMIGAGALPPGAVSVRVERGRVTGE